MDLITVTINEKQEQVVSARELHKGLEVTERFTNWFNRVSKYGFEENLDYIGCKVFNTLANQELQDYSITIDMAKQVAMMAKSGKGTLYRKYFIELERKWNDPQEVVKRGYAILQNENTQLKLENSKLVVENQIMQPKAQYFDDLVDRNLLTNFRDTAKMLKLKQKEFIKFLINKKYIYRDKKGKLMPYQQYNNVLFQIKESKGLNWEGVQTLVTPKGRETFNILLNN